MAKLFSNFRLVRTQDHPLGAQALIDITNHGRTQTILIRQDTLTLDWHYLSGSAKELHPSVLNQLKIPDDLTKPFWYDAHDADLAGFAKWVSDATASLARQLEANEENLAGLRRIGSDDLNKRILELVAERELLRGAVRELMGALSQVSYPL